MAGVVPLPGVTLSQLAPGVAVKVRGVLLLLTARLCEAGAEPPT